MTTRRMYRHRHMVNRAWFKVDQLVEMLSLHAPHRQREVQWLASHYTEGYPTADLDAVDRDAENILFLWLSDHFKKLQAREDAEAEL